MGNIIQSKINLKFNRWNNFTSQSYPNENYMINWPNSEHSHRDRIENTDDKLRAVYVVKRQNSLQHILRVMFLVSLISWFSENNRRQDNRRCGLFQLINYSYAQRWCRSIEINAHNKTIMLVLPHCRMRCDPLVVMSHNLNKR